MSDAKTEAAALTRLATLDLATKVDVLEDLRAADRILAGVGGTLDGVITGQLADTLGMPTNDGLAGGATVADVQHAQTELLNAQQALVDALRRLGVDPELAHEPVELRRWSRLEDILENELFDVLALMRARDNRGRASTVHERVRKLFDTVRASDPALASRVAPLAVWDEIETPLVVPGTLIPTIVMAIFALLWVLSWFW